MKDFNKTNYNIKRLQPSSESVELNKCNHYIDPNPSYDDKQIYDCVLCGEKIGTNLNLSDIINYSSALVEQLEIMKMIANYKLSKKEFKAAKKYFDMIPLLKNIDSLYHICNEELANDYLELSSTLVKIKDGAESFDDQKSNLDIPDNTKYILQELKNITNRASKEENDE